MSNISAIEVRVKNNWVIPPSFFSYAFVMHHTNCAPKNKQSRVIDSTKALQSAVLCSELTIVIVRLNFVVFCLRVYVTVSIYNIMPLILITFELSSE